MLNVEYNSRRMSITKKNDEIKICISISGKEIFIHLEDRMKGIEDLFG